FAMVYIDENDTIKCHASSFILNENQSFFISKLQDRFLEAARIKTSLDDSLDSSHDLLSLEIDDTEQIVTFYETALRTLQQINCRSIDFERSQIIKSRVVLKAVSSNRKRKRKLLRILHKSSECNDDVFQQKLQRAVIELRELI